MPRSVHEMLLAGVPRIQTQWKIIHADAAMMPHIKDESRKEQMQQWLAIVNGDGNSKHYGDVRAAILNGDLTDPEEIRKLLGPDVVIATTVEEVEAFFE